MFSRLETIFANYYANSNLTISMGFMHRGFIKIPLEIDISLISEMEFLQIYQAGKRSMKVRTKTGIEKLKL